jgi:hypothetical protein
MAQSYPLPAGLPTFFHQGLPTFVQSAEKNTALLRLLPTFATIWLQNKAWQNV